MKHGIAVIIGAGPAGLTAAIELQRHSGIKPILIEADAQVGGLSRTVCYKGNRMDIGGHRFFSKSDRVMQWWMDMMPFEATESANGELRYQGKKRGLLDPSRQADPKSNDLVMLVRQRKSRIYFMRRFFDYPIRISTDTIRKIGPVRTLRAGFSYVRSACFPRPERTLEDFFINRFGKELYETFFRSYTEKVWGVPCTQISAEWGAQRIKGLSLRAVLAHLLSKMSSSAKNKDIAQKRTQTSLIEKFLYPKFGPGQLWEHAADLVRGGGGEIHCGIKIDRINAEGAQIRSVEGRDSEGKRVTFSGEYFFSTMPIRDLICGLSTPVPVAVREVSDGLVYRDFITVGLLAKRLKITEPDGSALKDNWIYVQESDVLVGRLQIFNNWSPWLVSDQQKIWIGLEYFCNDSDLIWKLSDKEMANLAISEVSKIGILDAEDVEDVHVVRVPKTYPAYFGTYNRFDVIRNYVDKFNNLFLIGRNGMHKYNNQDHSMLTAMVAVENIVNGIRTKDNIWAVNTETDYHEENDESYES